MAGKRAARHGGIRRFAFVGLVVFTAAPPATAQERSFTVRNDSDVTLESVYVSPIYSKYWGSDLLGSTLAPGQTRRIEMSGYDRYCFFDLRFDDTSGQEHKLWAEDLCSRNMVEFR